MYDAYLDTVDYEGETIADAIGEIQRTLIEAHYGKILSVATLILRDKETFKVIAAIITAIDGSSNQPMILYLMVAKKHQGKGIGKWLLSHVIHILRQTQQGVEDIMTDYAKFEKIYLSVNIKNSIALDLYTSMGLQT
jgi:ribosomal protein S18 acetylase RimI-like enzyme